MIAGRVRPVVEFVQQRSQFASRRRIRFVDERFEDRVRRVVDSLGRPRRRRAPAVRAKLVSRCQRFAAVPTRLSDAIRAVVVLEEPRRAEDILGVLLAGDVLVYLPHVRVERPVDAVLDLRAAVPLADHSRDRGMTECVGLDRFVELRSVGDAFELLTRGVRNDTAVVGPSVPVLPTGVRLELVKQRCVRVVRSGMGRPEIRPDRRCRVDQRVLGDRRTLQPLGLRVRLIRRRVPEVHITDTQREREGQSRASVREELDEGDISLVARRRRQRLDVRRRQDVVDVEAVPVDARPLDVVGPLDIVGCHIVDEQQDGVLVGVDRRVREVVLVSECEDEVVIVVFVHLDERHLRAFAGDASTSEVRLQARRFEGAVFLSEPAADLFPVAVVDGVAVGEQSALSSEPAGEVLGIRCVAHTDITNRRYYKLTIGRSTCSIASELAEETPTTANKPDPAIGTAVAGGASA